MIIHSSSEKHSTNEAAITQLMIASLTWNLRLPAVVSLKGAADFRKQCGLKSLNEHTSALTGQASAYVQSTIISTGTTHFALPKTEEKLRRVEYNLSLQHYVASSTRSLWKSFRFLSESCRFLSQSCGSLWEMRPLTVQSGDSICYKYIVLSLPREYKNCKVSKVLYTIDNFSMKNRQFDVAVVVCTL